MLKESDYAEHGTSINPWESDMAYQWLRMPELLRESFVVRPDYSRDPTSRGGIISFTEDYLVGKEHPERYYDIWRCMAMSRPSDGVFLMLLTSMAFKPHIFDGVMRWYFAPMPPDMELVFRKLITTVGIYLNMLSMTRANVDYCCRVIVDVMTDVLVSCDVNKAHDLLTRLVAARNRARSTKSTRRLLAAEGYVDDDPDDTLDDPNSMRSSSASIDNNNNNTDNTDATPRSVSFALTDDEIFDQL